jgi:cell division protein FtsL
MKITTCALLVCLFLYTTDSDAQAIQQIEALERHIEDQQRQLDAIEFNVTLPE